MTIQQIRLRDWPIGLDKDAAYLTIGQTDLGKRLAVRFERGKDQLGKFNAALLVLPSGVEIALIEHKDAPISGTKLIMHRHASHDDLSLVLDALAIGDDDLSWVNPALVEPPEEERMQRRRRFGLRRPKPRPTLRDRRHPERRARFRLGQSTVRRSIPGQR